jgi:hypothetical protein
MTTLVDRVRAIGDHAIEQGGWNVNVSFCDGLFLLWHGVGYKDGTAGGGGGDVTGEFWTTIVFFGAGYIHVN